MSLRSFCRLLAQRRRAKVESSPGIVSQAASAGRRPARSLHTIRGVRAGASAYGAAAVIAAALTGGAGILIFKRRPDDDGPRPTHHMEVMKPKQEDINKDMGKHQMDVLEAMFHQWMEKVGREYPTEEEKAYRFELFKENQKETETVTQGRETLPNCFGDRTEDEIREMLNRCHKPRSKEYEASMMEMKKKIDERMILIRKEKAKRNVVNDSK